MKSTEIKRKLIIIFLLFAAASAAGGGWWTYKNWNWLGPRFNLGKAVLSGAIEVEEPPLNRQLASSPDACSGSRLEESVGDSDEDTPPDEGEKPLPPPAKPQNPVRKRCEFGLVDIELGTSHHNGHRIGEPVPIKLIVKVRPGVKLDFTSILKQELIEFGSEGSDYLLYGEPQLEKSFTGVDYPSLSDRLEEALYVVRYGTRSRVSVVPYDPKSDVRIVWTLKLQVLTFVAPVVKKAVPLVVNLNYATGATAAGEPNWQVLATPALVITTANTSDHGREMMEGNISALKPRRPWAVPLLYALGSILALTYPSILLLGLLLRIRPRRSGESAEERTWKMVRSVLPGKKPVTPSELQSVAAAVKEYLGVGALPTSNALEVIAAHKHVERIRLLLEACDACLYQDEPVTMTRRQLRTIFRKLVPRPWFL